VEEWLTDGRKLTERYIGEAMGEPLSFEVHSQKWGYPKTRGNLGRVRSRLKKFHEMEGYRDPVIIKLNPGSYVPVIAPNPVSTSVPDLEPVVERLVLGAKTALDARSLRGAWRALACYQQMPLSTGNPRHTANTVFIPVAAGTVIPSGVSVVRPLMDTAREQIRASGVEPWEWTFAEACGKTCFELRWQEALDLMGVAVTNSQARRRILGGTRRCLPAGAEWRKPSIFSIQPCATFCAPISLPGAILQRFKSWPGVSTTRRKYSPVASISRPRTIRQLRSIRRCSWKRRIA